MTGGTGAGLSEIEIYTKPSPVTPTRCTAPSNCGSCTNEECNERYRCYLENNVCKFNPCDSPWISPCTSQCTWSSSLLKCIPGVSGCSPTNCGSCTSTTCPTTAGCDWTGTSCVKCSDYTLANCPATCEKYNNNCVAGCPTGTTKCSDGVCRATCVTSLTCTIDGTCATNEGCNCADCSNKQDSCEIGLYCLPISASNTDKLCKSCSGSCAGANCEGTYSVVNGVCKCLEANGNECIILPPNSHTECSSSQCEVVSGAGTNTCTSSSQCTGTSHKECSAAGDCVSVSGAGRDLCTDDGQCNPTTEKHKGCTTAQQCIELAGTGADRCTGNTDCTGTDNVHKACVISNNQLTCLDVSGNAIDLCSATNPCGGVACQSYTTQATCPTATCEWSGAGTSNPQGGCCPKGLMKWNPALNNGQGGCWADFCTYLFPAGCGRQGTRITPDNCAQVNLRKICWQSASELPYGFWVPYNSY